MTLAVWSVDFLLHNWYWFQLFQQFLKLFVGVTQLLVEVVGATMFHNCTETISAEVLLSIHVGDGVHHWAQDDLHVIREVEL